VVEGYYQSFNESNSTSSSFTIAPDKGLHMQILSGRLLDKQGNDRSQFDVHEQIVLELTYVVRRQLTGTIVKVQLGAREQVLFWSFDTDTDLEKLNLRIPGIYHSTIEFPAPLLKEGKYSVSVGVGIANGEAIQDVDDCLTFEVVLLSNPSSFLGYAKKRPGILALPLTWNTNCEGR
jgi:lipopolysaccharide transport system ATP-binding protein